MKTLIAHLQGGPLNPRSPVAMTVKHFPAIRVDGKDLGSGLDVVAPRQEHDGQSPTADDLLTRLSHTPTKQ
jgi:hypothetical protein